MKKSFKSQANLLFLLLKNNAFVIFLFVIVFMSGSLLSSYLSPRTYRAEASILSLTGGYKNLYALGLDKITEAETPKLQTVLNSRVILEVVAKDLDLVGHLFPQTKNDPAEEEMELYFGSAVRKLARAIKFDRNRNLVTISVIWGDPIMAQKIANAYIDALGRIVNRSSLPISYRILDRPITPIKMYKPNTIVDILASLPMAFFMSVFLLFLLCLMNNKKGLPWLCCSTN